MRSVRLDQLDPEMSGGMGGSTKGGSTGEVVPVQLMVFRSTLGGDTVGLKVL